MKFFRRKETEPTTQEELLLASRRVMKKALNEIAYYCRDGETASKIAFDALIEQQVRYKDGVVMCRVADRSRDIE